jgi:hypothetical protein
MTEWLRSTDVQRLNERNDWPSTAGRPAWLRFLESTTGRDRMRLTREKQAIHVDWLRPEWSPIPGEHVILEPDEEGPCWVFLSDYTRIGRLRSPLMRPRNQIMEARVGERADIIEIKFFGPQLRRSHKPTNRGSQVRTLHRPPMSFQMAGKELQ